jgi:hypothetical protein
MQNNKDATSWDERKTAPAIILNVPNVVLGKLTRKGGFLPVWLSALILGLVIFLPSYALALLLGEQQQLRDIGWTVFSTLQLTYISVVACYYDLHLNILKTLRTKILPSIASKDDRAELLNSIQLTTRPKHSLILILSIILGVILVTGGTLAYGRHPGFGLPLSASFGGLFMGVVGYYLIWTLYLTRQLGNFRFRINEFTPGSSRIIHDIQGMLNRHVYILALFFMVVTIVISLDQYTVWFLGVGLLLGWTPTITQFFLTQHVIGRIIVNAKWEALEQIQSEIKALKNNGQLKDKETTDAINRLLDLHDRVQKIRNSTFDLHAGLNFLNQLMLPVVGWIIGNMERLASLIRSLLNAAR